MAAITRVSIGYGAIEYHKEIDAVPATSETNGNVTINNMGSPGTPAYYQARFYVSFDAEASGISSNSYVSFTVVVSEKSLEDKYNEIEAEAARQLAPLLREVATEIERQIGDMAAPAASPQEDGPKPD